MIGLLAGGESLALNIFGQGAGISPQNGSAHLHSQPAWENFTTDPQFGQVGGQLLLVLVREVAAQKRSESNAWIRDFISSGDSEVSQWNTYLSHVERRINQGSLTLGELPALLEAAPSTSGTPLVQFQDILTETDPAIFASDLLSLAQREQNRGRYPGFTQGLLEVAALHPHTSERAGRMLTIRAGGGTWGEQIEFQSTPLLRELTSPIALASFGSAVFAARLASLGVLSRAHRLSASTLFLSEAAALGVEVPTLVLTRRLGLQTFVGGENLFAGDALTRDLMATFAPFAFLRGAGNAFTFAAPVLRQARGFQTATGELTIFGRGAMGTTRVATEVSAVMGGHLFNGAAGFEPHPANGSQLLLSSLLTVGHMRIAGKMIEGLSPLGLTHAMAGQQARLRAQTTEDLLLQVGISPEHTLRPRIQQEILNAHQAGNVGPLRMNHWINLSQRGRNSLVASQMEARGLNLLSLYFSRGDSNRGWGDWGLGLETAGFNLGSLRLAPTGSRRNFQIGGMLEPIRMVQQNGNSGSGKGRNNGSEPPPSSETGKEQALREEIGSRGAKIAEEASKTDAPGLVQDSAHRLAEAARRLLENPDDSGETLKAELEEVQQDLRSADTSANKVRSMIQELSVFVAQVRSQGKGKDPGTKRTESDPAEDQPLVPSEPQTFVARILNPLGKLAVGARDGIKIFVDRIRRKEVQPPEENTEGSSESSDSGTGEPLDIDAIAQELERKAEQGSQISTAAKTLEGLRYLLESAAANRDRLDDDWRASMYERIQALKTMFPNLSWPALPFFSSTSAQVQSRREGALMGLAVRPEWIDQDSGLARRVRQDEAGHPVNRELSSLHDAILLGAHFPGRFGKLKTQVDQLVSEYGLQEESAAAVRLSAITTHRLVQGKVNADNLFPFLQKQTGGGPLESTIQSLEIALNPSVEVSQALGSLGGRAHQSNYLMTGLWALLRAHRGTVIFDDILTQAREANQQGFHPSIAISLFGASSGKNRLNTEWFYQGFEWRSFIERTQVEFDKHTD